MASPRAGLPLVLVALGLAGCTPVAPPVPDRLPPDPAPNARACGAAGLRGLVGQPRSVLAAMNLVAGTRVIEPGMAITEDYRETRLNIDLDAQGRIARLWCG